MARAKRQPRNLNWANSLYNALKKIDPDLVRTLNVACIHRNLYA